MTIKDSTETVDCRNKIVDLISKAVNTYVTLTFGEDVAKTFKIMCTVNKEKELRFLCSIYPKISIPTIVYDENRESSPSLITQEFSSAQASFLVNFVEGYRFKCDELIIYHAFEGIKNHYTREDLKDVYNHIKKYIESLYYNCAE